MSSVSETFGHLVESIEQSKDNAALWEQATRLAQTVAGTLVSSILEECCHEKKEHGVHGCLYCRIDTCIFR